MVNKVLGRGRLDGSEQKFFINNKEMPGIQSLNYNYSFPSSPSPYMGMQEVPVVFNGNPTASINIEYSLISDDFLLPYTGNLGFNGFLFEGRNKEYQNLIFESGYLNSYSCSCSIGQTPNCSANITSYGEIGNYNNKFFDIRSLINPDQNEFTNAEMNESITQIRSQKSSDLLRIAHPGSIILNLNDLENQTVTSFSVSINCAKNPIYALNNKKPVKMLKNSPVEVSASFVMKVNDYKLKKIMDYPKTDFVNDLEIIFKDYKTDTQFLNFSFDNMRLFNQSYQVSANEPNTLNLTFQGYYV